MKRSAVLIPFSHDHHGSLVLAKQVAAAGEDHARQARCIALVRGEHGPALLDHFAREETLIVPVLGAAEAALTRRFLADHRELAALIARIGTGDRAALAPFADLLTRHVRFEERELYPVFEAL